MVGKDLFGKKGLFRKKSRKGFVSAFMIVGFVILITSALFFYFKDMIVDDIEPIPNELVPLREYVEECLSKELEGAIFKASVQGGYVEIPYFISSDPRSYYDGATKIPYWWYEGQNRMISTYDIEMDAEDFIRERIDYCLQNFTAFEQFEVEKRGRPEPDVEIGINSVKVKMKYPLHVYYEKKAREADVTLFGAGLDVPLGKLLGTAQRIMILENTIDFLEETTMETIAASTESPYTGAEFTCAKREWDIERELKPNIMTSLHTNLRYLSFEGTANEESGIPYYDNLLRYDPNLEDFSEDVRVEPIYDSSKGFTLFDVTPKSGGTTGPMDLPITELPLCIKLYNQKYTMQYPMLFKLSAKDGNGDNFNFFFSTPVMIYKNAASRGGMVEAEREIEGIYNQDFCENYDENRASDITVVALDEYTKEPIYNASIDYQCIRFECPVGYTSYPQDEHGLYINFDTPEIKDTFPRCSGATFIANKDGYMEGKKKGVNVGKLTIDGETERHLHNGNVYVEMTKLKNFNYTIRVLEFSETGKLIMERALDPDEFVSINIFNEDKDFHKTVVKNMPENMEVAGEILTGEDIEKAESDPENPYNQLELMVGDYEYDIRAQLMEDKFMKGGFMGDVSFNPKRLQQGNFMIFYVFYVRGAEIGDGRMNKGLESYQLMTTLARIDAFKPQVDNILDPDMNIGFTINKQALTDESIKSAFKKSQDSMKTPSSGSGGILQGVVSGLLG